jgi:DNA replication and repair protein RecF
VWVRKLSLVNFKNYVDAQVEFCPEVNCFTGDNGTGKTNVLDAIHYLSLCKSYFNPIDSQNVRYEEDFFVVQGKVQAEDELDNVYCGVKKGQKKVFKRNDKEYDRLADHIGKYPAVIVTPNDVEIIKGGSEIRRKFMDSIISQYSHAYLDDLIRYNKALIQRNNLLKHFFVERTFNEESLSVWDAQLIDLGQRIYEHRQDFATKLAPLFQDFYAKISGNREEVVLRYHSDLHDNDFAELLKGSRDKDRRFQRTTVGIHKDDLEFLIGGHPLKRFGSQGQQKSFLIALKLAQFDFIKQSTGEVPFLLLDDIFDKIDDHRVANLMELVSEHRFGQIFITDTHQGRVPELFRNINAEVCEFMVSDGKIEALKTYDDEPIG